MGEITIFKDAITENVLQEIQDKIKFLPGIIKNKSEFNIIYANYQEVRKIRIAINKKAKELISSKRSTFELEKQLVIGAELKIVNILSEVEDKLKLTRETWEESERIKKEKKAAEIAEKQKAEFNRQEILRVWETAVLENAAFNLKVFADLAREKESERLEGEAEKLKQREEELNAREKELELQEKEKISDAKTVASGKEKKPFIDGFGIITELGEIPIIKRKDEVDQEDDDCSEFDFTCPSCDFKFNE